MKPNVNSALLKAFSHERKGELDEARKLYQAVLQYYPNNVRAVKGLADIDKLKPSVSNQGANPSQQQLDALIELYNKGLLSAVVAEASSLVADFPASFILWNILGVANKGLGRLKEAEEGFRKATEANPRYADAHYNMGVTFEEQGKLGEAVTAYQCALQLKPNYPNADYNMGNALRAQGKLDEAIGAFKRALQRKPDDAPTHYNLGIILQDQGNLDEAIAAYQRALQLKPDYADAYINIGKALKEQGKLDQAITACQRALQLKPDYAAGHNNMGVILQIQGKLDEAITACQRALQLKPDYAAGHYNMGVILQIQGKLDEAIAAYQRALQLKPDYAIAEAHIMHQLCHVCDWSQIDLRNEACSRLGIVTGAVSPFCMLSLEDNAERQLKRSLAWAKEQYKQQPLPLSAMPQMRPKRLKIGYFSADFHNHATLYLMAGVLREHDKTEFELFAYSYGRSVSGELRQKAEQDVDHFFTVTDQSNSQICDLARSHGLDIAVDLKGYTEDTRSGIFQFRLAPVQINYLGYPGSMGADFVDYIIADPTVIPNSQRSHYSEKVIYLPHSYQPNDQAREIANTQTMRADFGLPQDAFVFCCFNNNYKISPREFDIWMRLLARTKESVLWLLKSNPWAEGNLRKEAQARGIDPNRLIFAERLPHGEHLARHKHADLFIDTFNYNAHTTTSDALWAGLPVVTKQGQQFAARVAASLLNAVGLPDLITDTEEEYEDLIFELFSSPDKLYAIKARLNANRLSEPLFDTKRYTRDLEKSFRISYDLYFNGEDFQDIFVE